MKEYTYEIGGIEHTFQFSDKDAEARGLDPAKDGKAIKPATSPLVPETKSAPAPGNKSGVPAGDK